jgi:hypothetical protein
VHFLYLYYLRSNSVIKSCFWKQNVCVWGGSYQRDITCFLRTPLTSKSHISPVVNISTLTKNNILHTVISSNSTQKDLELLKSEHRRSWHELTTPLFSNFLFTNLFSIKFLYFFIISSLFPYFNLFVSIFIQSYVNIKLHVSTL